MNGNNITYDMDDFLSAERSHWSLKIQAAMLLFLDVTGLSPWHASNNKNNAPHSVPYTTLWRWKQHFDLFGEPPKITRKYYLRRGRPKIINSIVKRMIIDEITRKPYLFLDELQHYIHQRTNVIFTLKAISRCLLDEKLTSKVLQERAAQACEYEEHVYRQCLLATVDDPRQLVFVDETHRSRNDGRRRRGRSKKGTAAIRRVLFDASSRDNYTFIGAVNIDGFIRPACEVVFAKRSATDQDPSRGTVDSERFVSYVEEKLVPNLKPYPLPNSVVVMDNASIHKDDLVVQMIEGVGAKIIWTAAYAPWLNPIEKCFNVYKARLRRLESLPNAYEKHLLALDAVDHSMMFNYYKSIKCIKNLALVDYVAIKDRKKKRRREIEKVLMLVLIDREIKRRRR